MKKYLCSSIRIRWQNICVYGRRIITVCYYKKISRGLGQGSIKTKNLLILVSVPNSVIVYLISWDTLFVQKSIQTTNKISEILKMWIILPFQMMRIYFFEKYLITVFGTINHGKWNTNFIQTLDNTRQQVLFIKSFLFKNYFTDQKQSAQVRISTDSSWVTQNSWNQWSHLSRWT